MRNSIILIIIGVFSVTCSPSKPQTITDSNFTFEQQLGKILNEINNVKNTDEIPDKINKLKRLDVIYSNEWLPSYYIILLDIKLSLATIDLKKKELILADAKQTLDRIKKYVASKESEICTLEGYYYYALIAKDPNKNGQLYYQAVIGAYQKAIAIDNQNPRPVFLLALFQKMMSNFTGGENKSFCQELEKIKILFENTKLENELHPKWGSEELKMQQQQNCKD